MDHKFYIGMWLWLGFIMLQVLLDLSGKTFTAILLLMYGLIEALIPFMLMRFLDLLQRNRQNMYISNREDCMFAPLAELEMISVLFLLLPI